MFLAGGDRSGGSESRTALDIDLDASSMSEFGDVVDAADVPPSDSDSDSDSDSEAAEAAAAGAAAAGAGDAGAAAAGGGGAGGEYGWARVLEEMADGDGAADCKCCSVP